MSEPQGNFELVFEGPLFDFADAFAGIGGFHAALSSLGGRCVWASEIDEAAAQVYAHNWGMMPTGDIRPQTENKMVSVPGHDIFAGGFPCQPFSKSGFQRGMSETRGTLFWNILRVLEDRRPAVVVLENVRNLAGPRQRETWQTIVRSLRDLGYRVSSEPSVFSPHLLPPEAGGAPQVRERVFITGTQVGRKAARQAADLPPLLTPTPLPGWNPLNWRIDEYLDDDETIPSLHRYQLSDDEVAMIEIWNEFVAAVDTDRPLPGFPIWADALTYPAVIPAGTPAWKANFLRKNADLFRRNERAITRWFDKHEGLQHLAPSRRKLEWQAQNTERNLWNCVLHFRPSGIRAKRPTYLPALVAITQTSVIGPRRRRITPREASRLQGLPDWFDFNGQRDAESYKQLGNGVNVGVVQHVLRAHAERDADDLPEHLLSALLKPPAEPARPLALR